MKLQKPTSTFSQMLTTLVFWLLSAQKLESFHYRQYFRSSYTYSSQILRDGLSTIGSFGDFDHLPTWLIDNCEKLGFIKPTSVQAKAIPVLQYLISLYFTSH